MYNSLSKKQWKTHKIKSWEPIVFEDKPTVCKNNNYIPKSQRIQWCRTGNKNKVPCYRCLKSNCPFFAYTDSDKSDYKLFNKAIKEEIK